MITENLCIAQCLYAHPVMSEKDSYKEKYINVIEYFTNLYSYDDEFSKSMLKAYKDKFIAKKTYKYDEKEIKKSFKRATVHKLNGFKLFTYRYNLLFDCFLINAFNDHKKAKNITNKIKILFNPRYQKKIEMLYARLYNNKIEYSFPILSEQIKCWDLNKQFSQEKLEKIVITATMSAGKSTLINALIGKKINRTQNDVCTSKIHYIFNKPYEDHFSYEWDNKLNIDADLATLMEDDENNATDNIYVSTYFNTLYSENKRVCIIDTPGVNSSFNSLHKKITENIIAKKNYDKIICVLNAGNIGTDDEKKHLNYIYETARDKHIIFVINKLDSYQKGEDSVSETVLNVKNELLAIGFVNPIICPMSAYVASLAKKAILKQVLDEDEQFELKMYLRKFKDSEYDLSKYNTKIDETDTCSDTNKQLLCYSGYENLEKLIMK